jgi:hypothetical protein
MHPGKMEKEINILSLGVGVQSVTLYFMSCMDILPRADYAIFSDTGGEKKKTYEYLAYMQKWAAENNGIPIVHSKLRNLAEDLKKGNRPNSRFVSSIPAFTKNADGTIGMLKRQCSAYYKREVVDQEIKLLLGIKSFVGYKGKINVWIGISADEIGRMKHSTARWKDCWHPLVGYASSKKDVWRIPKPYDVTYTRAACLSWLADNGFPIPVKSGCVFCPYTYDWDEVYEEPDDWKLAVDIDEAIRNSTKAGITQPIFLNDNLLPLKELKATGQMKLFKQEPCTDGCFL